MDIENAHRAPAHRALRLEYLTVALALAEALIALLSGLQARSVVLIAFGADSVIEMLSALVVLAQLTELANARGGGGRGEHRSHRLLAVLFFALALYVTVSALWALIHSHHAHENALGIGIALASCVAMPILALAKRRNARDLAREGLNPLARLMAADAAETALCAVLAVSTLIGVALAAAHWWWADPGASLVVVYFALREGYEAWQCQ
jgi:divalent metal cation (Fe/Co/Zn/Cd) transporter